MDVPERQREEGRREGGSRIWGPGVVPRWRSGVATGRKKHRSDTRHGDRRWLAGSLVRLRNGRDRWGPVGSARFGMGSDDLR